MPLYPRPYGVAWRAIRHCQRTEAGPTKVAAGHAAHTTKHAAHPARHAAHAAPCAAEWHAAATATLQATK